MAEFIAFTAIAGLSAGFTYLALSGDGPTDTDRWLLIFGYGVLGFVLLAILKLPLEALDPEAFRRVTSPDDAVGLVAFLPFESIDKAFGDAFSFRSMIAGLMGGVFLKALRSV